MALTDTGTPDDERSEASRRLFEQISKSRGIDIPPQNVQDTYTPSLPESISPLSPQGQLTRVAQTDSATATDGNATFDQRFPEQPPDWLTSLKDQPWPKNLTWGSDDEARAAEKNQQEKTQKKVELSAQRDAQISLPQPQRPQLPTSPAGNMRSMLSGFAPILAIAGIFAASGGRRHAINAMAGIGGLTEAMGARNAELAKLHYQKFRGSVNSLISETAALNEQYNEIFNDPNRSDADKIADAHALAAGHEDKTMMGYLGKGDLSGAQGLVNGPRKQFVEGLINNRSRASHGAGAKDGDGGELSDEEAKALYEGAEKYPSGKLGRRLFNQVRELYPDASMAAFDKRKAGETTTAREQARAEASQPTLNQNARKVYSDALAGGNMQILRTIPGTGPEGRANRTAVLNDAADTIQAKVNALRAAGDEEGAKREEMHFNRMTAAFNAMQAGSKRVGTIVANVETALQQARKAADRVLETSAKVPRTQFPDLNSLVLAAERKTGGEAVVNFGIAMETLLVNYSNAMSSRGQQTDLARRHAYDMLSTSYSQGQVESGIQQILREIDSELAGAEEGLPSVIDLLSNPFERKARGGGSGGAGATQGWH